MRFGNDSFLICILRPSASSNDPKRRGDLFSDRARFSQPFLSGTAREMGGKRRMETEPEAVANVVFLSVGSAAGTVPTKNKRQATTPGRGRSRLPGAPTHCTELLLILRFSDTSIFAVYRAGGHPQDHLLKSGRRLREDKCRSEIGVGVGSRTAT